ncbi:hypothetical protein E1301_Tti022886 [Triplophysa tibetana]|uniref:Integrase core domain-containing protein n=1 Tax=Triplophysa tibetana TaxID=1572043 RepID=A0A5A9MXK7_9TELE|nr:hypothetical protein E1301_Tti022886 [Triplophysa tibetana]
MCGVICNYYSAFRHLEELSLLDPDQDLHLICLHYIMLPRLNHHLQMFTRTWDNHSLSTEGNMSPSQLWLAGHVMNSQLFLHTEYHRTLGIDWDAPVAVPDPVQEVILPEPPLALQDIINSHLSLTIDPLMVIEVTSEGTDENCLNSLEGDVDEDNIISPVIEVTSEGTDENCLDNLEGDVDEDNIISPVVEFTSEGMSVDGPDNLEENVDEDSINAPAPNSPQVQRDHRQLISAEDFFVNSTLADSDDEDIRLASPVRRFSGNLQKCNTEADFNEIKSNLGDWISECGVPSIFSSTFQDVTSVFTQILKHYIYHRVASLVQQFKAGMNSCNLFWEKVATDWHEFLPIFTHTSVRLSRTVFRELFYVKWSAEGSNRREKEEDTMYQWECLLMSIQVCQYSAVSEALKTFTHCTRVMMMMMI